MQLLMRRPEISGFISVSPPANLGHLLLESVVGDLRLGLALGGGLLLAATGLVGGLLEVFFDGPAGEGDVGAELLICRSDGGLGRAG